jgi:hypothetical protein
MEGDYFVVMISLVKNLGIYWLAVNFERYSNEMRRNIDAGGVSRSYTSNSYQCNGRKKVRIYLAKEIGLQNVGLKLPAKQAYG